MSARRRTSTSAAVALLGVLLAVLGAFAVPAASESSEVPTLQLRSVDARSDDLTVDVISTAKPSGSARVTIDGVAHDATVESLRDAGLDSNVVVVLDNSELLRNGTVQLAKAALGKLAPGDGAISKLGVVSTGGKAVIASGLVTSLDGVMSSAKAIAPSGSNSLWSSVVLAADLVAKGGEAQRSIVVITGSPDGGVGTSFSVAQRAVRDAGATVHVIAVTGGAATPDGAALRQLVASAGGSLRQGGDDELGAMAGDAATLIGSQYRLTVKGLGISKKEISSISVSMSGATATGAFRPRVLSTGAEALTAVQTADEAGGTFANPIMKYVIVGLGALCAGGTFLAVALLVARRNDGLDKALRHYDERYNSRAVADDSGEEGLAKTALVQRAVEMTGALAEKRGFLARVALLLDRADLPLRPAEALFFYAAGAGVLVLITFTLTTNVIMTAAALILSLVAPGFVVDFLAKRRKKKFTALLPDTLQLLAGTLRAGYSIAQGFEAVSKEVEDPMGKELRQAVTEARLGRQLDDALDAVAERMNSEDFEWAVMAIRIQREVGGNLAELLMSVSETMVQRERLRRDVAALTAEGRMSAWVLGMLPPGIGLVMFMMNREYISRLFSGLGLWILVGAVVSMLIGFVWMKKTITIEV